MFGFYTLSSDNKVMATIWDPLKCFVPPALITTVEAVGKKTADSSDVGVVPTSDESAGFFQQHQKNKSLKKKRCRRRNMRRRK